jgi:hypothetical protein
MWSMLGQKIYDKRMSASDTNISCIEHVGKCLKLVGKTPSVSTDSLSTDKAIMQFCTDAEI